MISRARVLVLLAMAVASTTGCVQRRMTIRSNPPGALVYIDDYEVGTTPVSTDFTYYGTREIRLVKDGYETLVVKQPIPPPWYQVFPFEFFADNVVPREIRDERVIDLQMQPHVMVPNEQLIGRAEGLRQSSQMAAPAAAAVIAPPPVTYENVPAPSPTAQPVVPPPPVNTLPAPGYTPYP